MKKCNGFSIIELLTSMGIIAILAAVALPNYISWRENANLKNAANAIKNDIEMAKMQALRRNAIVALIFTAKAYYIFFDNGANSGDWTLDSDEVIIKRNHLPANVSIELPTTLDTPNNRIRFSGRGLPDPGTLKGAGLTGTLTVINSKGRKKQIRINRLGRVADL